MLDIFIISTHLFIIFAYCIDCQTCYLIYVNSPRHTPKLSTKHEDENLKTNKQLIYEFQREIDRKEYEQRYGESGHRMVEVDDELPSSCEGPFKNRSVPIPCVTPELKMRKSYVNNK